MGCASMERGTLAYTTIAGSTRGIYASRSSTDPATTLQVTNSTISGSEFGVYLDHVQPSPFTSNTLSSAGRALWLYDGIAATTPLAGNHFPGGGHVHLGGYSALAASTTFPALSYVLENSFDVPAGVTLTVQPGAVLNARRYATFTVHGGLVATGTSTSGITWRLDPSETLAWYGLRFMVERAAHWPIPPSPAARAASMPAAAAPIPPRRCR